MLRRLSNKSKLTTTANQNIFTTFDLKLQYIKIMKYNSDHIDPFIAALRDGSGRVRACASANIHYSTFLDWMENKPEFSEMVKKAEKDGNDKIKDICMRRIIENESWQSAAWWLERNYPEQFRDRRGFPPLQMDVGAAKEKITGFTICIQEKNPPQDDTSLG